MATRILALTAIMIIIGLSNGLSASDLRELAAYFYNAAEMLDRDAYSTLAYQETQAQSLSPNKCKCFSSTTSDLTQTKSKYFSQAEQLTDQSTDDSQEEDSSSSIQPKHLHQVSISKSNGHVTNDDSLDIKLFSKVQAKANDDDLCQLSQIHLTTVTEGNGATQSDVKALIGSPTKLGLAKVLQTGFKSMDGRYTDPVLATLGGDAGEFLLALHAYHQLHPNDLEGKDLEDLQGLLSKYLAWLSEKGKTFNFLSDDRAISHLEKELGISDLDIFAPSIGIQNNLMAKVAEYKNIGDPHLKAMVQYHTVYGIDPSLLESYIQAIYWTLWNGSDDLLHTINFDIFPSSHSEEAVLEIKTDDHCLQNNRAPLIPVRSLEHSVFALHVDAIKLYRAQLIGFFQSENLIEEDEAESLLSKINSVGDKWLKLTVDKIGKGLPVYSVSFA